jgi:hypothetical protein
MLVSRATGILLQKLNEASDISYFSTCDLAWPLVELYNNLEVWDKREGAMIENAYILSDIRCSREFVRFVHQRNSSNCLESAFNE